MGRSANGEPCSAGRSSPGEAFAQNLEQTLEQYPDAAILDGGTPPAFGIFWPMDPYERTSEQLVIFPRQPRFTDVMTEPWVLTDDGRVLPARMEGTPFERGKDFCGTLVRGSATFAVPGEPYAWQRTLFIDYLAQKAMTITVRGPNGNIVDLKVKNPDHFKVVKVGDQIQAVYVEALAIAIEPVAKAAK